MAFYLDGQFLGIHLPIFSSPLSAQLTTLGKGDILECAPRSWCLESHVTCHSRDRDVSVYNRFLHNQLPRDIRVLLLCWGPENKKRMGFIFFFSASKRDLFCFAYRLGFRDSLVQNFWEDFFSVFRSGFAGPSRGWRQMQATGESVASKTPTAQSCWEGAQCFSFPFLSFYTKCTMSFLGGTENL
ncbi:hypothetical protein V8C34DRAFT_153113 [Trichoderma compactum]